MSVRQDLISTRLEKYCLKLWFGSAKTFGSWALVVVVVASLDAFIFFVSFLSTSPIDPRAHESHDRLKICASDILLVHIVQFVQGLRLRICRDST